MLSLEQIRFGACTYICFQFYCPRLSLEQTRFGALAARAIFFVGGAKFLVANAIFFVGPLLSSLARLPGPSPNSLQTLFLYQRQVSSIPSIHGSALSSCCFHPGCCLCQGALSIQGTAQVTRSPSSTVALHTSLGTIDDGRRRIYFTNSLNEGSNRMGLDGLSCQPEEHYDYIIQHQYIISCRRA